MTNPSNMSLSGAQSGQNGRASAERNAVQVGILAPLTPLARNLYFRIDCVASLDPCLRRLSDLAHGDHTVVGIGRSLALALGARVEGLRDFPTLTGAAIEVPATPQAMWCWLRGDDRGELLHRSRRIEAALAPALQLDHAVDAFVYAGGRDLSGYEDGTENPQDQAADDAAIFRRSDSLVDGSSYVAVQQWLHDLDRFDAMPPQEQDRTIGRRRSDNRELDDAPASAHVKRTAQESFDPEAFVLRRSMPWSEGTRSGLVFVAFGRSFDAYEAQLKRMTGHEDGITDALFRFTRPLTGAYFWCPGLREGRLDLRALGI